VRRPISSLQSPILLILAWALLLYRLDGQSFWYDEGYAVYTASLDPAQTLLWSSRDFVPPLHPYVLALWLPLAGWTEFAARFISVWAGTLMAIGMIRLGRELHSCTAGLLAGLLAALSPFYIWHARDARMYTPQALFGLLATILLVRALREPERWALWGGFALLDALTLYTHTTGGFLLIFHALAILTTGLRSSERAVIWKRGGLALTGVALAWLPWLVYALPFLGENAGYWAGQLDWWFVVSGAFRGFVTGQMMDGTAKAAALVTWGLGCLVGILFPDPRGFLKPQRSKLFLLAYFAVPVAAMALLFRAAPKFSPRYLILASPPLFLLPAIGSAELLRRPGARRILGVLLFTALMTTAGLGLRNLYSNPAFAKSDFRAAARLVQEQRAAEETVLIVPGHTFPVWQYYFGPDDWVALPDDPILDVRHILHYPYTAVQLNDALAGYAGVWLVEWEPWVADPTDLVAHLLEQVGEEMPLAEEPAGVRLRHYRLRSDQLPLPPEPAVTPPLDSALGLPLNLIGCTLPERIRGDEEVQVGCYWKAQDVLPHHLSVSARLVDTAGVEWGQADSAISGPYLVAGRWPVDEPVLGRYSLRPAPGIPPGDFYQLRLRAYEPDGTAHGAVTVGPVTIAPPSSPFTGAISSTPARLGGLALETASVDPPQVLPGESVRVEAEWRVVGPFHEPRLVIEGLTDEIPLLPQPGATETWEVGDRYRTVTRVTMSPYALGGPTRLLAVSEEGEIPVGTVQVNITRTFTLPAGVQPADYRLGEGISLAGAQFVAAGEMAQVVLYWRAKGFVEQSYTVFVHLVGPDGQIHAQADALPQAGRHPTDHWLPGEVVADSYRLELPAQAPPGEYQVLTGLYDLATLERPPVTDAGGDPVPDDAILIGSWEVP